MLRSSYRVNVRQHESFSLPALPETHTNTHTQTHLPPCLQPILLILPPCIIRIQVQTRNTNVDTHKSLSIFIPASEQVHFVANVSIKCHYHSVRVSSWPGVVWGQVLNCCQMHVQTQRAAKRLVAWCVGDFYA